MNLVSAKRGTITRKMRDISVTSGESEGNGRRARSGPAASGILQHNPAKDKAEDHAQRDSDNAGDQEGVVKDIFTNAG